MSRAVAAFAVDQVQILCGLMSATFDPGGGPSDWLSAEAPRYFEQLDAPSEFIGEPAAEYGTIPPRC